MADDVTSQATLSASSTDPSYPLSNATDGSTSTLWRCNVGGVGWLMFTLSVAKCITRLDIWGATNRIKDFTFQASTDESTWSNLYTGQNTNDNVLVTHTIPNTSSFKYYRIYITSTWGNIDDYFPGVSEVKIYAAEYAALGNAIYSLSGVTGTVNASSISWTESKPNGTTVLVSVSTDGASYTAVTNGGAMLPTGTYDNQTVYVKVEMSTTDATITPTISGLNYTIQTIEDTKTVVLEMEPLQRFESAVGEITVAYSGGTLQGEGGPVEAFSQKFTPTDLAYKGDQNDAEHLELTSVTAIGVLTKINYINTTVQDQGHIEMSSITAVGTLTHVDNV